LGRRFGGIEWRNGGNALTAKAAYPKATPLREPEKLSAVTLQGEESKPVVSRVERIVVYPNEQRS